VSENVKEVQMRLEKLNV